MTISGNIVETRMARASGHFGEWLQGRIGPKGPIALISVQCPVFWAQVSYASGDAFQYTDPLPALSSDRAMALLSALSLPVQGSISGRTNIEAGAGLGASTSSLLALAKALIKRDIHPEDLAKILVAIEGASDPLMFPDFDRLLWASREARVVNHFPAPPQFEVIGGCWGAPSETDPRDQNFPDIADLVEAWRPAITASDREKTAAIATESFRRTTAIRNRSVEPTEDLARDLGALGVIRAHTGSARGFLFEPGRAPSTGLHQLQEAGYSPPVTFLTGG